jgi:cyclopropane fatty-acyl-phospholipid synthase-like methyltransferase
MENMKTKSLDMDELQSLLWSFARHRVVTVASRVGILRLLSEGKKSEKEVAAELGLDPLATTKMVRALSALGLVASDQDGYQAAPSLARYFRTGPNDIAPFLDHSHHLYDSWGENLEHWLKGKAWETRARDAEGVKKFGEAMQAAAAMVADQVVDHLNLRAVRRMLDVGGGVGAYAKAYCRASADIEAVVLDTERTAALGRELIAREGLEARIRFIGGDYFETDFGQRFDLVQIANVLHQETKERAAELVRRAALALAPGGRLVVVDFSIDDAGNENEIGALFAINMRSFGDTHNEPTLRAWMANAGLISIIREDIGTIRWMIVGHKPG